MRGPPSGDTTYSSDPNGDNLGPAGGPIHYNAQDQVDQISSTSGTGPVSQTYTDQGNNLRQTATVPTGPAANPTATTSTDTFTQGGPLGVTARTTTTNAAGVATGTTITYYTRDPYGQLLDEHAPNDATCHNTPATDFYYELDRQGSTIALIDNSGNVAASYTYAPYGATTETDGTSNTAGENNPWRWIGGYQDPTDGYYHLAARYYDTAGHFTQADPVPGDITRPEKYNPYTYTAGDPTNNTDLSGNGLFDAFGEAFGVVGGALGAAGFGEALTGIVEVAGEATGLVAAGVGLAAGAAILGIGVGLGAAGYFAYKASQN